MQLVLIAVFRRKKCPSGDSSMHHWCCSGTRLF